MNEFIYKTDTDSQEQKQIYGDQKGKEGKGGNFAMWTNRYTLLYIK